MRVASCAFLLVLSTPAWASAQTVLLPVTFHVAADETGPVIDQGALEEWIHRANESYAEAGVALSIDGIRALGGDRAELRTIRDRRRLSRFMVPKTINVFIVRRILDPVPSAATRRAAAWQGREPTGLLGGAHVRVRGRVPDTYILITSRSTALTLAHEVGHFLGAPHHADPENIMSYGRDRRRFDERQLRVFRIFARRHLRRGSLRQR